MIITLSPAKILDFKTPLDIKQSSKPLFNSQVEELIELLKKYNKEELMDLMKLNRKQTSDVFEKIQTFSLTTTPFRQAAYAYNGIAYQGLNFHNLSASDIEYAEKHLYIFSGLYGLLKPLDLIKPYRLDFNILFRINGNQSLYNYWSDVITNHFNKLLNADDDSCWINLTSNEYSKVINRKLLSKNVRIITPLFKEFDGRKYKQVIVHAKKARGMMARFIIQNKLTTIEHIKAFNEGGYCFAPQLSSKDEWIFTLNS